MPGVCTEPLLDGSGMGVNEVAITEKPAEPSTYEKSARRQEVKILTEMLCHPRSRTVSSRSRCSISARSRLDLGSISARSRTAIIATTASPIILSGPSRTASVASAARDIGPVGGPSLSPARSAIATVPMSSIAASTVRRRPGAAGAMHTA